MADSSYSPLDSDENGMGGYYVGSRTARAEKSSALQEYGPRPLASVLDYYYGSEQVHLSLLLTLRLLFKLSVLKRLQDRACSPLMKIKKTVELILLSLFLLFVLPHTFISFIFMYSTSQHLPLLLLVVPMVLFLYGEQSCSCLTGCLVFVYAFWHDFSFFDSFLRVLWGDFPRVLWLCMPLQAKMYSVALTIIQTISILVVLRFSFSQVPRCDVATLKRNWFRARAGVVAIGSCFLLMCCLDAARMHHPFSSTPTALTNISTISIATGIQSFAALSACAISHEGRLFCSNSELRLDNHGSVSVFDVIGLHDFYGADLQYGFGRQLLLPSDMHNSGSRVEHVSVGGTHVCAVASGLYLADRPVWGKVWYWPWFMRDQMMWNHRNYSAVVCWGYNDHGQLGTGVATDAKDRKYGTFREYSELPDEVTLLSQSLSDEPVYETSMLLPDDKVIHLATGHCHTCALTLLGSLFCWGCNTFGQVGSPLYCPMQPQQNICSSPAAVLFSHMNITSPISLAAAADNTCAIVGPHDAVVCWGRNNQAQLGRSANVSDPLAPAEENSPHAHSEYPWFVDGLPDGAVSLALGREHACASFANGMLRCWGSNQWGQLGASACGVDKQCRSPVVVHLHKSLALAPQVLSSICAGNRITCGLVDSILYCLGPFVNRSISNHPLGFNDSLPQGSFHISDNAVSVACSVNDRSHRFGLMRPRPEVRELDEYGLSAPQYAVKSMGLVEGICVKNESGHVKCIEGQFCDENGDSCSNGSFVASFSHHERLTANWEVGILLFLGHTWHLLFYYRYFLLTLLNLMFSSQERDPGGAGNDFQLINIEQYRECSSQIESMGFAPDAARQAAAVASGDLHAALGWLAEHPGAPYEDVLRFLGLSVIEKIGQGGSGSVYKCSSASERGRFIAVKVISYAINSRDEQYATREGQRLANCNHENIVRMYKVHQPPNFPGICVFEMEFVTEGDLRRHLRRRLPHDCVLRFTRQLLNALVYLHDSQKLLHGDIKPHNILIENDSPIIDSSLADYSMSVLKLADFGLAKSVAAAASSDSTTRAGAGTEWYMSSEALKGRQRCYADDVWSACLVVMEMDTGMPLHQLMHGPGSVKVNELLINSSPDLLPMLHSVLLGNDASRSLNARNLLLHLDICIDAMFEWQVFDGSQFVAVSAAASLVLENALTAGASRAALHLPPPLDLEFDIKAICDKADGLGTQSHSLSGGHPCSIRRLLRPHVHSIPIWQQLVHGKDWRQLNPHICAKLENELRRTGKANVAAISRRLLIERNTLGPVLIPFPRQREPYCVTLLSSNGAITHPSASPVDIDALTAQVHESLPEFDITHLETVVNQTQENKYAGYRQRMATRCNGNPNERFLFHFCPDPVIPKIWQEGEGHDTRLSQWAEVGKGAYFSEHVIYGYAYKFNLWEGGAEPAIGESFRVFITLVALGNCKDLGGGCGTCTSPEWEEWKKEFAPMKIDNPTRPPEFSLHTLDAGERKHRLDLMGVKDKPRYDSVTSTEGDLGTSPASTYMNKARTHLVRDVMHPRLLQRARDWGRQYVVFETSASYPMYILTLTKKRDGHVTLTSRSH